MNAGYFLIQLASEKNKEKVYKEIGETIRKDAKGVKQVYPFCLLEEIPISWIFRTGCLYWCH